MISGRIVQNYPQILQKQITRKETEKAQYSISVSIPETRISFLTLIQNANNNNMRLAANSATQRGHTYCPWPSVVVGRAGPWILGFYLRKHHKVNGHKTHDTGKDRTRLPQRRDLIGLLISLTARMAEFLQIYRGLFQIFVLKKLFALEEKPVHIRKPSKPTMFLTVI